MPHTKACNYTNKITKVNNALNLMCNTPMKDDNLQLCMQYLHHLLHCAHRDRCVSGIIRARGLKEKKEKSTFANTKADCFVNAAVL